MYKEERQQKIIELLDENSYVSVNKLGKMLYVSLPTVRRDLCELEKKGLIVRNHGGAMRLSEGAYNIPLDFRNSYKAAQKHQLCKNAAKLIQSGDVIYIDASTSTMHIADFISAKDITVVTNGLPIASLLAKKGINVQMTGGVVKDYSLACVGSVAERFVSTFNFNFAFFSAYGVNSNNVIVDTSLEETAVRKAAFANSDKTVFICTSDKYGLQAPYNIVSIDEVDIIISDK